MDLPITTYDLRKEFMNELITKYSNLQINNALPLGILPDGIVPEYEDVSFSLTTQNGSDSCHLIEIVGRQFTGKTSLVVDVRSWRIEGTNLILEREKIDGILQDLINREGKLIDESINRDEFAESLRKFCNQVYAFSHIRGFSFMETSDAIAYKRNGNIFTFKLLNFTDNFTLGVRDHENDIINDLLFDIASMEWSASHEGRSPRFPLALNRLSSLAQVCSPRSSDEMRLDTLYEFVNNYPDIGRLYTKYKNVYNRDLLIHYLGSFYGNSKNTFYPKNEEEVTQLLEIARGIPFPFTLE